MRLSLIRNVLLFALLLSACGSDDASGADAGDGSTDASEDVALDGPAPSCDAVEPFERGEASGTLLRASGASAGRALAGTLPDDPDDLAVWAEGDFVLANQRVALVIEDTGPSDGYDPWGGKPVGLARVEGGALVEPASFGELLLGIGRYTIRVDHVGVLANGDDGGPAIVRAVGELQAIPFIDRFATAFYPIDYDGVAAAIDYVLEPNADAVEIRLYLRSPFPNSRRLNQTVLLFQRERMDAFEPVTGFDVGEELDYLAFVNAGETGYAIEDPEGPMLLALEVSGTALIAATSSRIEGCGEVELNALRMTIGGPDLPGLQQVLDEGSRALSGTVRDESGAPLAGVRVHAENDSAYLSRATTDGDGRFMLTVPPGALTLRTFDRRYAEGQANVGADDETADIVVPTSGELQLELVQGARAVPARVEILPAAGPALRAPASWGEAPRPQGRREVRFPAEGSARIPLPPGEHRVLVSRGFGYEIGLDEVITIRAGETVERSVELVPVVFEDTLCADYHIHTHRSPDSPDPAGFKVRAAAGDGLDIALRSDHEWIKPWGEIIANEGLEDWVFGITSLELTTFDWGHFGVFPLDPTDAPSGGAIVWPYRAPSDVFAEVRSLASSPTLIINHPRSAVGQGYFTAAGYDPITGAVDNPELWDDTFTVVEVFNDASFDESPDLIEDWFSFLRTGRRVWAVGSSDSHGVQGGAPVGYPRTCLDLDEASVAELRAGGGRDSVQTQTENGHFFVSGGIDLRVRAGEAGPGDTVRSAGSATSVDAQIRAPSWVDVDRVEIYIDGIMSERRMIDATRDVDRGTYTFNVPVAEGGSWAIVHAAGSMPLSPIWDTRQPFAVSMPIYFER